MTESSFATLPAPPYYAVIFSSQRTPGDDGYADAAQHMLQLAGAQQGHLGVESVRGADGFGLTVSYWESEAAITGWRQNAEHVATREHGRGRWYEHFEVRVARVERAYAGPPKKNP